MDSIKLSEVVKSMLNIKCCIIAKSAERKVRENNWCVLTIFKMVFGTAERNINSVFTMGKNTHKNENKDVK